MKQLKSHYLMIILIIIWTLDVLSVSDAMTNMNQIFVLFSKYVSALIPVTLFIIFVEGIVIPSKKDLPLIMLSSILGDLGYFFFEYTALKYTSGALVTILLGLLPLVSLLVESVILKKRIPGKLFFEIMMAFFGVVLILANQVGSFESNTLKGVLCCGICLTIWIVYGEVVKKINTTYSSLQITLYQMICAIILMAPIALTHLPANHIPVSSLLYELVFMGILSSGIGVMIEIKGLVDLGIMTTGIYLNLLPVTTAILEFFIYQRTLTFIQCLGFVLVIGFSILVVLGQGGIKE